jgi:hypothetical protein
LENAINEFNPRTYTNSYGYSILNIANWFLAREESQYLTLEHIQRLCWYANEFTIANTEKKLFNDSFYIYKDIPSSITLLHNFRQYDLFEPLPRLQDKPYIKDEEIRKYLEDIFIFFGNATLENEENAFVVHALEDTQNEKERSLWKEYFCKIKNFFQITLL